MKKHTLKTRHALLLSMISLMTCFAMLLGSTFAWFTDYNGPLVKTTN